MSDDLAALAAEAYIYGFPLIPPGWQGQAPGRARVIEFPTDVGTIVGRWACDGPADLDAVRALQSGLALEPPATPVSPKGVPEPTALPAGLTFFEQLRTWMQAFPPSAADQAYQQRFAPLGLLDPSSPYPARPPGRRYQQLAARPGRAVPAAHAPVPAAGRRAGRHLHDPAHHQGGELRVSP